MRRMASRALWIAATAFPIALAVYASGAWAATVARPGYVISSNGVPTMFSSEHDGSPTPDAYFLTVTNAGSVPSSGSTIKVVDTLPAALTATAIEGRVASSQVALSCELPKTTCSYAGVLKPGESLLVLVSVKVTPGATGSVTNTARVEGGGPAAVSTSAPTRLGSAAESSEVPFGLESFTSEVTNADGLTDTQAGDHPYETTVSFALNSIPDASAGSYRPAGGLGGGEGSAKDFVVNLPQGFLGDPDIIEKCPQYKVPNHECPAASQIGVAKVVIGSLAQTDGHLNDFEISPVYNVVPDSGYPAQFEFTVIEKFPVSLYATVSPETNYGVRVTVPDIPAAGRVIASSVTFFGTPLSDPNYLNGNPGLASGGSPFTFLENPTGCTDEPQSMSVSTDSWQHPGAMLPDGAPNPNDPNWVTATSTLFPQITGCELLSFNPSLSVQPDTSQADEPTGLKVDLSVPQAPLLSPDLGNPELRDTTVTLPSGFSISPAAADGLQGCTDTQIALLSSSRGSCPLASEIGTVKATTPLLDEALEGQVFVGTPHCDPCTNADASDGNMYRFFLQLAGSGVVVKKEGAIYANTLTGQLTATVKGIPQVPVGNIELQFKGGLRATLATPQECGTFTSTSDLTPWSAPITPDATPQSPFRVDWNGDGGACPTAAPFDPHFEAGTSNPDAGQLSPLTVTLDRQDREQDLAAVQVTTPPGLLGSLANVSLCGEPRADLGTCPEASRIGSVTAAAGPGSHPFYEHGSLYLTGPYKGAPFGLSVVVPTTAGPFNLGNVVVRAQINIDPRTAALTVTSDPIPQILDGIPLRLRVTNFTVDRPGFIFNPTNCAQQAITATFTGARGAQARESVPFAVSGCAGLHFGPRFTVSTSGHTSRVDGASLDATVTVPAGTQSNIAHVKVSLPKQLPARLTTLQKACLARTFEANPAVCPASSLIGAAEVTTPVLPVPLTGPAYFVSNGSAKFPELIIVLQGYGVRVDLHGETFISKSGVTSSTFANVPDVPFDKFQLYLPEGPHSALTVNAKLCHAKKLVLPTQFTAQDGAQLDQNTPLTISGCPKSKVTKKNRKASKATKASATLQIARDR
ncbi:MAG TPA: hypothetical protein VNY52_06380 [Solirubrobacteraceae bacterium]|jgi:hypothetical protein|nr:hypothetical protein [Solirubrobacteraceae bacterium]